MLCARGDLGITPPDVYSYAAVHPLTPAAETSNDAAAAADADISIIGEL